MPRLSPARRTALLGAGALCAVLAVGLTVVPDDGARGPAEADPARPRPVQEVPASEREPAFGTWSPTYMADEHLYTRAEAVALARRFDLVAALPTTFPEHVAAMRAANPELVLLTYTNGMLTPPGQVGRLPDAWFATDEEGGQIRSRSFGQFLMDPGNPEWRRHSTDLCVEKAARTGSDGCLVDMLTMGVFAPNYLDAAPAGTTADRPGVEARYQQGLVQLAEAFADLPGLVIAGNTVTSARRYFAPFADTRSIAAALPLNQAEDFLRAASDPAHAFPTEERWRADVAVLQDLDRLGSRSLVTTKLWRPADEDLTRQWQRLSIGSFLLGAGEGSYHSFTSSRTRNGATGVDHSYALPDEIGAPAGGMLTWKGLYARSFSGGIVLVNPTSSPVGAELPATLRSWDGEDVADVEVPAHDATVLLGATPPLPGATVAPASGENGEVPR